MARLQARLNVARLAASRLGDYYPKVHCFINSVAVHTNTTRGRLMKESLSISGSTEDDPGRASFKLRNVSSPFSGGERVYIGLGSADHIIFSGSVIRSKQESIRQIEAPVYDVECENNLRLFNRRLVRARYTARDAGDIIRDIVATYTSGFSSARVTGSLGSVDEIEFTHERPTKAITRVCQRVGATWYLDPRGTVHAFIGTENGAPTFSTIGTTAKIENFEYERDITQTRTKVFVAGWRAPILGDFQGEPIDVGKEGVGLDDVGPYADATTVGLGTAFHGVTSIDQAVSPAGSGVVFFSPPTSVAHARGTELIIYGVAQDLAAQAVLAALEGGDGVHEDYVSDGRLTQSGANDRAQAELTLAKDPEHRGKFITRDPNASTGVQFAISVTSPTNVSSVQVGMRRLKWNRFEDSTRAWSSTRTHLFPEATVDFSNRALRDLYQVLGDLERDGR